MIGSLGAISTGAGSDAGAACGVAAATSGWPSPRRILRVTALSPLAIACPFYAAIVSESLRGAQPQRDMGRLHCFVHDVAELEPERVEVALLAHPRAEALERTGGVVAAPIEAPVDPVLDPSAGRPKQRRHRQRRDRHGERGPG